MKIIIWVVWLPGLSAAAIIARSSHRIETVSPSCPPSAAPLQTARRRLP
ncbi:hypothetical protein [Maliponia aquimaris]|nr:hypothetical protein [Maliponia aquimaris]